MRLKWKSRVGIVLAVLVLLGLVTYQWYGADLVELTRPGWGGVRQDFDFESLHADVRVQPGERRMTSDYTLVLKARHGGARVFHLVSQHLLEDRDYQQAQAVPGEPAMNIEEVALRGVWRAWRINLDEPVGAGAEVTVTFSVVTTVVDRYPDKRVWQGIVPRGVYGMEWLPYVPGVLDSAHWLDPGQITARITMPPDFVFVNNSCNAAYHRVRPGTYDVTEVYGPNGGLVFAGPYAYSDRFEVPGSGGIIVKTYAYAEKRAQEYRKWASEALPIYNELFGWVRWLSEHDTMVIIELPREHGGGVRYEGLIGMAEELTPGLSHAVALDLLAYHEIGHSWDVMHRVTGDWNYDYEALTQYKVFLLLEKLAGRDRAMEYLNQRKDAYVEAAAGHRVPAIAEANLQYDDPLRQPLFYDKGVWIWHSLRFLMGDDAFFRMLAALYQGPELDYAQFRAEVEQFSGKKLGSFLDQCIYGRGTVQLAVSDLQSNAAAAVPGDEGDNGGYTTTFRLVSTGAVVPPSIEVELVGEGEGATKLEIVHPCKGVSTVTVTTPFRVTGVNVDPNEWYLALPPDANEVAAALKWDSVTSMMGSILVWVVPGLLVLGLLGIVALLVRNRTRSRPKTRDFKGLP